MPILNLEDAPHDPIRRLAWLGGVMDAVRSELDEAFADAYYDARLQRRFESALGLGLHSTKRALAFTRAVNEKRGRSVRWGDGLDSTSSAYDG